MKFVSGQGDNYATGYLLNDPYFKTNHKLIAIDLSKETSFDANPEATQQFSFTENLGLNATLVLILEKLKETILHFQQEAVRVL